MPCDTQWSTGQTLQERKVEIRDTVDVLAKMLAAGRVKATVGKAGGIAFTDAATGQAVDLLQRRGITDACAYRRIMATGGALARHMIAKAEAAAGRTVDRATLATGLHSHDGGRSWGRD